jgi:hypothetical protein
VGYYVLVDYRKEFGGTRIRGLLWFFCALPDLS